LVVVGVGVDVDIGVDVNDDNGVDVDNGNGADTITGVDEDIGVDVDTDNGDDKSIGVNVDIDVVTGFGVVVVVFCFGRQHLILLEAPGHKPDMTKPVVQFIGFIHFPQLTVHKLVGDGVGVDDNVDDDIGFGVVTGVVTGVVNGAVNGVVNGAVNGVVNGIVNGVVNGVVTGFGVVDVLCFGIQHLILLEPPGHNPATTMPLVQCIGFIHFPP